MPPSSGFTATCLTSTRLLSLRKDPGPLLFAIFIIDLPSNLVFSNHMVYADDSQIYHHCLTSEILHGNSYKNSFLPWQLQPTSRSDHTYLQIPPTSLLPIWHQISTNRRLEALFLKLWSLALSKLVVTVFDRDRESEFKKWLYTLFLKHDINQWSSKASRKHYTSTDLISILPHPQLPLNQSAFTFKNTFLNTPGYCLRLPFIDRLTYNIQSHLWPLKLQPTVVNLSSSSFFSPFP